MKGEKRFPNFCLQLRKMLASRWPSFNLQGRSRKTRISTRFAKASQQQHALCSFPNYQRNIESSLPGVSAGPQYRKVHVEHEILETLVLAQGPPTSMSFRELLMFPRNGPSHKPIDVFAKSHGYLCSSRTPLHIGRMVI